MLPTPVPPRSTAVWSPTPSLGGSAGLAAGAQRRLAAQCGGHSWHCGNGPTTRDVCR